ncbi:hypothetical protein HOY80DRAFT_1035161 [Tuber brumale]|nr:hypothetical protein HOY80DRAFT_1035161 [Tuber brumale]
MATFAWEFTLIPVEETESEGRIVRLLPGLIGFCRLIEFSLYPPRRTAGGPALARPTAYRPAYQRPGPLGTLLRGVVFSRGEPVEAGRDSGLQAASREMLQKQYIIDGDGVFRTLIWRLSSSRIL